MLPNASYYVATPILGGVFMYIVYSGIFMALTILFTYVFAVQTTFIRIDFAFIPIAIYASMWGAKKTVIMAALADIIGSNLFMPGLYFPGFTLSAAVSAFIYGRFLHKQEITLKKLCIMNFCVFLFVDCILNNIWLTLMYHDAAAAFYSFRLVKSALLIFVKSAVLYNLYKPLKVFILKYNK